MLELAELLDVQAAPIYAQLVTYFKGLLCCEMLYGYPRRAPLAPSSLPVQYASSNVAR
jgi:hypothetical protein